MPKPEIHYSVAFGMGFYIAEDGTLMSMPAVTDADGRTTMDVDNEIAVDEWDDPSVYSPSHMMVLAQITWGRFWISLNQSLSSHLTKVCLKLSVSL